MLQYYKGHFHIPCRSGETGRRTGLKIQRAYAHVGSTPTSGTSKQTRLYPGRSSGIKPFVFCNYSFLGMVLIDGMGKNMLYKDKKATMYYRQMKKSSLHY